MIYIGNSSSLIIVYLNKVINPINSMNAINPTNPINTTNPINSINATNAINAVNPINSINSINSINATNTINSINDYKKLINQDLTPDVSVRFRLCKVNYINWALFVIEYSIWRFLWE